MPPHRSPISSFTVLFTVVIGSISQAVFASDALDIDGLGTNIPAVLTPTRLKQSLSDVPSSVTIITAEMIKRFGIFTVPDALRLVPGMAITDVTGSDTRINYHGTNILVPRRLNVLIDGVSIYRPAIARVDWTEIPVDIDDIARIEVTRSPNSASYGGNSMLAIVNIITKVPSEVEGTTISTTLGSLNTVNGSARYGGKIGDSTLFRLTLSHQQNSGFDTSSFGQAHDSTRLNKLNFRSITDISNDETLDLQAMLVQGMTEISFADRYQKTYPDVTLQDYNLSAIWRKTLSSDHEIQIQAYSTQHNNDQPWITCPPAAMLLPEMFNLWHANPGYANDLLAGRIPTGGTNNDMALATLAYKAIKKLGTQAAQPVCANTNQNYIERRHDLEVQDTYVFSKKIRMVNGVGLRQDIGDSQTYLAGRASNLSFRVFSNVEYKPIAWLDINAGGYLEKDQITGTVFSPRVALNTHINPNQTLRFVVSRGSRMPDIQEQRGNWTYSSTVGRFYQSAVSPGNLSPENILSREIGYLGNFPSYGLLVDAKIFDDKLYDLISEKLQLSNFQPTNNNSANLRGAELQLNFEPSDQWLGFLTYSYLHNNATTNLEQTQNARHLGSLGISRTFSDRWRMSLASYGSSAGTFSQSFYGRQDFTVSNTVILKSGTRLTTSFTARHLDNRYAQYFNDFNNTRFSAYNDSMQFFLSSQFTF